MAARRDLPDIMGEALGRLSLAGSPTARPKVLPLGPEPVAGVSLPDLAERLRRLRLEGMAQRLVQQAQPGEAPPLGFAPRLADLVQAEEARRQERRLRERLKRAGLDQAPRLGEVDCAPAGGPAPEIVARLVRADWLQTPRNLIFHGPTGSGKTFLATALGREMVLRGFRVVYRGVARLARELALSASLASQARAFRSLVRADLLILDDLGLTPLEEKLLLHLHEVLEKRAGRRATLAISPLPPPAWPARLGGGDLGAALADRLRAGAWPLAWSGPSRRGRNQAGFTV